ncbi:cysteine-rich CWC family protein [Mangrovibacterium marinum]|uniref:Cysteine-rich CWC n=1 Tax=Mangrovibacterium marinum TaxID=1639118 RepID=A0A2T5BYP6_9BACT|nr:cysteine-rich CWC family protein [Mangrovibacterium marinum]PTN07361.1 Cysteine-rich CWC [Mangrovibacterium marinum]
MNNYEAQTCESCGNDVHCHGDLNCECADLLIPEHVQDLIGASYDRCLCRKCILKLMAERRE